MGRPLAFGGDAALGDRDMDRLLAVGFKRVATWRRMDTGEVRCEGAIPTGAGIYVFAVAGAIRYVGAAVNLSSRIHSYERHQNKPKPGRRPIHERLTEALGSGAKVEVYVLEPRFSDELTWKGLPIDPVLGIEAGLIASLNPSWNRRGKTSLLDSETVPP